MYARGWRVGRIGGVGIHADPSVLVVALLIAFQVWSALSEPFRFPDLGSSQAAALSVLTAVLFLLSILAHELAHAGMSVARGIPVRGITLYMFGGATHHAREARRPVDEFLVTVVGPATTAALGAVFLLLHAVAGRALAPQARAILGYLALVNFVMAGFNLLPGYPLDGGRLLLSGLWRATGERERALRTAARLGQVLALLIVLAGVALTVRTGDVVFGLWAAFVGWFLFQAAGSSLAEGRRREVLRGTTAGEVMSPPPPVVAPDMTVGAARERYLAGHDGEAFPVVEDGHAIGFVSLRTTRGVDPGRPVREAMAGPEAVIEAGPEDRMDVLALRLAERRVQAVLVFDGGRLVGVIEPEDLARFLSRARA